MSADNSLPAPAARPAVRAGATDAAAAGGPHVMRVEPPDGAQGVLRDDPVAVIFSHAVDASSVTAGVLSVAGPGGPAVGSVRLSSNGRLLVWTPERLMDANGEHEVRVSGLRDLRGHDVEPHTSRFTSCRLAASDLMA